MKIAIIAVRVLIGALLIFASVMYFFKLGPQPELTGNMRVFMDGMVASNYLLNFIKAVELVCGILFFVGYFVPLATVVIFPITINIVCVHAFLAPEGLPVALFLLFGNLFLAYVYRERYLPMLAAK